MMALAGSLAGKKSVPPGPGTLLTNGPLFACLLIGVVIIVGALTFFPVLSLSPIAEHFAAQAGKVY
jgi:K+-transporting ATPase ATPase A chain